jgi:hypothetical protein
VVYAALCIFSGIWAALIARSKGSPAWIWFVVGAVVPILGVVAAALYRYEVDELRRACPACGKVVPMHDAICTRCGTELDFPQVPIAPESATRAGV